MNQAFSGNYDLEYSKRPLSHSTESDLTAGELVTRYFDAWNRRDLAAVLDCLSPGAAYYDALWRESCVGRYLPKYLEDNLAEDQYWYELPGELIVTKEAIVCRYVAFDWVESTIGKKRFEGAEVLTVQDDKILTISDYYYDPDTVVLEEIAKLSVLRHGLPSYVDARQGGYKQAQVKRRVVEALTRDFTRLDGSLTIADLAQQAGCSVDHLLTIIGKEFGIQVEKYRNRPMTEVANLLRH